MFGDKHAKASVSRDGLSLHGEKIPRKCPLFFSDCMVKSDLTLLSALFYSPTYAVFVIL